MAEMDKVLLLDDDAVFAEVLEASLQKRGLRVKTAHSIAAALEQMQGFIPDIAVLDLKLERESGLDAIQPLLACNRSMKILVLTGYSSIATAVTAIKLGAFDYACKPLDADEILLKLGHAPEHVPAAQIPDHPPSVDRIEWEHIQRVLAENDGNISATARSLGMHRRTLQRKLQKRPVRS